MFLDQWAQEVMSQYPKALRGDLVFLGNHGGFSGSRLWRLEAAGESYCLKVWPGDWRPAGELAWIHSLLARASSLPWLPHVIPTSRGESFVNLHGRLWELATWMPGSSDPAPSTARLEAACTALAQLHQAWTPSTHRHGVCPAVERRLDTWRRWHPLVQSQWRPSWHATDPYRLLAEELCDLLAAQFHGVLGRLTSWLGYSGSIQPCVCDLWHDHVLFGGDTVTGIIDFGSAKEDHVAIDLARLLGAYARADTASWEVGLAAYRKVRPLTDKEAALARDLDITGTILAAANWLRWLYVDERKYDHPQTVCERLAYLAGRLRKFADVTL